MTTTITNLQDKFKTLKLKNASDNIAKLLSFGVENSLSSEKLIEYILDQEIKSREAARLNKYLKQAAFPEYKTLDEFNLEEQQTLSKKQLNQLKELSWLERGYNIILLGPTGVGKTHLSIGLGTHAINEGYRVIFAGMSDLIYWLKTADMITSSKTKLNRVLKSDLLIIDDIMFMAIKKQESNLFFQLINKLYGQTSIIITSNKGPSEWGELLGDQAITAAILDRIVHKCEIINLDGDSYRLAHRETIFGIY
ncbi:MAG: IS21-like element helper ATPase IstB [Halanaerobium sp.]